jgi:hypothetical protein
MDPGPTTPGSPEAAPYPASPYPEAPHPEAPHPAAGTDVGGAAAGAEATAAEPASAAEAATAEAASEAPARGFPGFPAGDPKQLPLSQRPRGLDAPPVPGGRDPEIRETLTRERPYMRLLIGMVAVIVGGSLILTFLALISAAILR